MTNRVEERRRYLRLNISIQMEYILPNSNKRHVVTTKDISAVGLKFTSTEQLEQGTSLEITLRLPNTQNPVHITGRVAWITKESLEDNAPSAIGIEFVKIEEDNKNTFLKYLCDLIYG